MRKFLQWLLKRPVTWLANRVSSSPDRADVFRSLSQLLDNIRNSKTNSGPILTYNLGHSRYVILSDQHKGARDGADDFRLAEDNYAAALQYYFDQNFTLVSLGDCEELWENKPKAVIEKNRDLLKMEARFLADQRYYRTFGNHDLEWKYEFPRNLYLRPIFGKELKVFEGILLKVPHQEKEYSIFLTHGHQGDKKSDGNPFSTWVVAALWTPIQRFLEISVNTVATSFDLVDKHNIIMYDWSATQENLIFISGHTHKPVFASFDHIERLLLELEKAKAGKDEAAIVRINKELEKRRTEYAGKQVTKTMAVPSYFNSGCCCFSDGDMTGIEIDRDAIRLIKWQTPNGNPERTVLEECPLTYLLDKLGETQAGI